MNGLKQTCKCGHDRSTHFVEFPSTGDVTRPAESGRAVFGMCLGTHCDCPQYDLPDEAA